jgi:RIO kinase 1
MKTPKGLLPLLEDGIIDTVLRQLQSGKEAAVYVVSCGDKIRCAKVYKEVQQRSFKHAVEYTEGRKARGSRNARAAGKNSRYGRKVKEVQWKNAEVDALHRLANAGVRVPQSHGVFDGVLLMELITDADGQPAPRLSDVHMVLEEAVQWHEFMIRQIVRMLCVGLIHGDLSEFNILIGPDGPVIIDLPQAVNAAGNNNAFRMLSRDINNMRTTFGRVAPEILDTEYALEIWTAFAAGKLNPESQLSGIFVRDETAADVEAVLDHIEEARREAEARQRGREEAAQLETELG